MKRALVIVPHQDDEINLVGNIIEKVKREYEVYVLYSSLDIREREGSIRKREAYEACAIFGIDKEHIIFLDYPDTPNVAGKHFFTDGNESIVTDLENNLLQLRPSVIFATDFDFHSDHRMLSIAFDKAMGRVLHYDKSFRTIVLKGFCYETAYYGPDDYKASLLGKSLSRYEILSNCSFEWEHRVSILSDEKPGVIWKRRAFYALRKHKSQYAVLQARSIMNADNVFWNRRTDNQMMSAKISTSVGGEVLRLNDFLIIDTNDIISLDPREIDYSKGVWFAKSKEADIVIKWDSKVELDRLIFHGNPNWVQDKKITVEIVKDGQTVLGRADTIRAYGRDTIVLFERIEVDELCVRVRAEDDLIELSEVEAFCGEATLPALVDNNAQLLGNDNLLIDWIDKIGFRTIVLMARIDRKLRKILR